MSSGEIFKSLSNYFLNLTSCNVMVIFRLRTIEKQKRNRTEENQEKDDSIENPQVYRHSLLGIFMVCAMTAGTKTSKLSFLISQSI